MSGKKARLERKDSGNMEPLHLNANDELTSDNIGCCIFCGRKGNMSKQHIWPEWMSSVLPIKLPRTLHTLMRPDYDFLPGYFQQKVSNGHPGTQKLRKVCRSCNSGWVNVLETKMRPIFTKLALNQPIILDPNSQLTLATWAILATMIYEFKDEATRAAPLEHRRYMYNHVLPPDRWQVWIGKKDPSMEQTQSIKHRATELTEPYSMLPTLIPNSQATVFVANELIILTTMVPFGPNFEFKGKLKRKMKLIHPLVDENLNWNEIETINENQVEGLRDDFVNFYSNYH